MAERVITKARLQHEYWHVTAYRSLYKLTDYKDKDQVDYGCAAKERLLLELIKEIDDQ